MFMPARGVSVDQVLADGREESSDDPATAAKGTRDLTRDATFYGLADVAQDVPVRVTELLHAGTYYLVDLEAPAGSPPRWQRCGSAAARTVGRTPWTRTFRRS